MSPTQMSLLTLTPSGKRCCIKDLSSSVIQHPASFHISVFHFSIQVMTFEEDSKDVQEAEEEIPAVSAEAEEMLEGREEQVEEGGEEDVEGKPEEGGDDEASAEELQ